MNNNQKNKNKKSGLGGALVWIILVMAMSMFRNFDGVPSKAAPLLIPAAVVIVVVVILAAAAKKGAAARAAKTPGEPWNGRSASRAGSGQADPWDAKPAARRAPAPTAELATSSEYDTERDRSRRRQQLDTFLKNGIIDRKEYMMLLARHEGR